MTGVARALAVAAALLAGAAGAEPAARLTGHGGPVQAVARSPDGATALTASFDYAAALWDVDAGAATRWLRGHDAAVTAAVFAPDGATAFTGSDDFTAIRWRLSDGAMLARFEGHRGKVQGLAVSPGGAMLATASWDGRVGLWDAATGASLGWLEGHKAGVNAVAFGADGARLWSAGQDGAVLRWSVAERRLEATEASHGFGVNLIALDEAAGWLAYGAVDGAVRVRSLADGSQIADLTAGRRPALALDLSPDGSLMAIGDGEGYINVRSTDDWTIMRDFRAVPRGPIWALAFFETEAGLSLLAGGLDSHVDVWPLAQARSVREADLKRPFQITEGLSNGERQFVRKCSVCHTLTPEGGNRAGPTLHGLFGRPAGAVEGYDYSPALTDADIVWTAETVSALFDVGPDHYTPGSKMPMQRITGAQDRADLVAWLQDATRPEGAGTTGETTP